MTIDDAAPFLIAGSRVKRPSWTGYLQIVGGSGQAHLMRADIGGWSTYIATPDDLAADDFVLAR